MPSEFTGSPRILKGALAVYESQDAGTEPSLIMFQFNPDQMRRTLARRSAPPEPGNSGAARQDVMRVPGPPVESISLTITLDATDQLVAPDENPSVAENGLHPVLAKLEMLLYPPSLQVQELENLLEQGEVQISPQDLPMVLLVWGECRVVPVQLTNFTVTCSPMSNCSRRASAVTPLWPTRDKKKIWQQSTSRGADRTAREGFCPSERRGTGRCFSKAAAMRKSRHEPSWMPEGSKPATKVSALSPRHRRVLATWSVGESASTI